MQKVWTTPSGERYTLYSDMLKQPHLLIAGATGSGKSVVINGLIYTALYDSPAAVEFILIDPKRVELVDYKPLPHTLRYASEPDTMIEALEYSMTVIEARFKDMGRRHIKEWDGGDVYVIIDELADLMTTQRRRVQPLLQRICQIGRAAHVHVIAATQSPIAKVIPTEIKVNFDSRVGLRTGSAQDSRNILGVKGCETFPDPKTEQRALGYYRQGANLTLYNIPMQAQDDINAMLDYWRRCKPRYKLFA